jgi:hypothetical protein
MPNKQYINKLVRTNARRIFYSFAGGIWHLYSHHGTTLPTLSDLLIG